jgi:hypothetical protein
MDWHFSSMADDILLIQDMAKRHIGLTEAIAASYEEAARVCLDRHHVPPAIASIQDDDALHRARAEWDRCDERTRAAWANDTDATEHGAYAVILAAVEVTRRFTAVRRAETGTGADYYVGPAGSGVDDLEDCFRLEISGTDVENSRELARRLVIKVGQARNGDSALPAIAGVVAFPRFEIRLRSVA